MTHKEDIHFSTKFFTTENSIEMAQHNSFQKSSNNTTSFKEDILT